MTMHVGWYLVAFTDSLQEEVTPLTIDGLQLMLVRSNDTVRAFDAICPHRGAHLAYGGRLLSECAMRCPFHGRSIALGNTARPYSVAEYECVEASGMVFVRFGDNCDNGFRAVIDELACQRRMVKVVEDSIPVPPHIVIENAFDPEHFEALHQMPGMHDFAIAAGLPGQLRVTGMMNNGADAGFVATAYSPNLVITQLRFAERTQLIITGAVPTADGCVARIGYAIRPQDEALWQRWAVGTRLGFAQDLPIWRHMDATISPLFGEQDLVLAAWGDYVKAFPTLEGPPCG